MLLNKRVTKSTVADSIDHILNWPFLADAGGKQWIYAVFNIQYRKRSKITVFAAASAGNGQLRIWYNILRVL